MKRIMTFALAVIIVVGGGFYFFFHHEPPKPASTSTPVKSKPAPIKEEKKSEPKKVQTASSKPTAALPIPIWKNIGLGKIVSINADSIVINEVMSGDMTLHFTLPVSSLRNGGNSDFPKAFKAGDAVRFFCTNLSDGSTKLDFIEAITDAQLDENSDLPEQTDITSLTFIRMDGQLYVVTDGNKEYELNPNYDNKLVFKNAKAGDKFTGTRYTYHLNQKDEFQLIDLVKKA